MQRLRAAIVGAGLIATKKHIPAFSKLKSKVELAALCDLSLQAAREAASRSGVLGAYGVLSEMLEREKPDLVDICTPPQTHVRLAVEAIRRGCHVLIEKPMALAVPDCDEIIHAARQHGVKVCVAHSGLFYRPVIEARERLARGEIGDFRGMRIFLSTPTDYMTSQEGHWAHRLPGGIISETGPHAVYLSLAFINPIQEARVAAFKLLDHPWSPFDDYRIELIGDRGISSITLSYATDQWTACIDILGSRGTLRLDLEAMSLVRLRRPALKPLPIGLSMLSEAAQVVAQAFSNGIRFVTGSLAGTHDLLVERFVDCILGEGEPPVAAEEGRDTVRVMNMILDGLRERQDSGRAREDFR